MTTDFRALCAELVKGVDLLWFTLGALFGFMHSRLGRYNRMKDFNRLRGFSHENIAPNSSKQRPRSFTTDWRHSFGHENTNRPVDPRNDPDYDTFPYGTEPLPGDTTWAKTKGKKENTGGRTDAVPPAHLPPV